jgi:hypothetical protein
MVTTAALLAVALLLTEAFLLLALGPAAVMLPAFMDNLDSLLLGAFLATAARMVLAVVPGALLDLDLGSLLVWIGLVGLVTAATAAVAVSPSGAAFLGLALGLGVPLFLGLLGLLRLVLLRLGLGFVLFLLFLLAFVVATFIGSASVNGLSAILQCLSLVLGLCGGGIGVFRVSLSANYWLELVAAM